MTTSYLRLRRATAAIFLIAVLLAVLAWHSAAASASGAATIRLQPGYNTVTWNSAEPYPISDFDDTPITQIHRWDALEQDWLSRFVGRGGATLPELHLLPRVQYLIVAEGKHELEVPDPIAEIDPHAALHYAAPPDDPLRFEAYWPNEDSPLEDLVVLRGEDRRLSVKAEIAGGVGEIEVYWVLDGRLNHQGLASDDVDLTPGGHDHGRLYAVDDAAQVVVVELPRIVRLPSLESLDLPEMQFGVAAYVLGVASSWSPDDLNDPEFCEIKRNLCVYTRNLEAGLAAIDLIADAGFSIARVHNLWGLLGFWRGVSVDLLDRVMERFEEHGIAVMPLEYFYPEWAAAKDLSLGRGTATEPERDGGRRRSYGGPLADPRHYDFYFELASHRYPDIRYWQLINEPDLKNGFQAPDPVSLSDHYRAGALRAWYANPDAVVVGPGMSQILLNGPFGGGRSRNPFELLEEMLHFGIGDYVDVYDLHYYNGCSYRIAGGASSKLQEMVDFLDAYRGIMAKHGQGEKQLWLTEIGVHSNVAPDPQEEADCIVESLSYLDQRPDVNAAFIHAFLQGSDNYVLGSAGLVFGPFENGTFTLKPAYHAVKEYIANRQPAGE